MKPIRLTMQAFGSYGEKTVVELSALAYASKKSLAFVKKDVAKLIEEKYFKEGHLDDSGTTLIVSNAGYKEYQNLQMERKSQAEEREKENESYRDSGLSEEGIRIVRLGEEYIKKIHQFNVKLTGKVITEKLQKLEDVMRRILTEVRSQPGKATDLRKLMNYYLPTTEKLLNSYEEIEREPLKTDEMRKVQGEIEETLDRINQAFEKLLQDLFRNRSWDISSDISVLNTMLKKDNLAGESPVDFTK